MMILVIGDGEKVFSVGRPASRSFNHGFPVAVVHCSSVCTRPASLTKIGSVEASISSLGRVCEK